MFHTSVRWLAASDFVRKIRRSVDLNLSYRKIFFLIVIVTVFLIYIAPLIARKIFGDVEFKKDPLERCVDDRLTPFYLQIYEFSANIRHIPNLSNKERFIAYIGNGYFGLEVSSDAYFNIKYGRSLRFPVYFHPLVSIPSLNVPFKEATVVEYYDGIAHRFQCFRDYFVSYEYYAHRNLPSILVQEIKITNTINQAINVDLQLPRISNWPGVTIQDIRLQHGSSILDYILISGKVRPDLNKDLIIVVSIVTRKLSHSIILTQRGITKLELLTAICYSKPISEDKYVEEKARIDKAAVDAMKNALREVQHENLEIYYAFKKQHIKVWNNLWSTNFWISYSKAENSINGDRINATIYAVLSNVRSYEYEELITPQKKHSIEQALAYAEGCYDSYHTLQAENLWLDMDSLNSLNTLVDRWILTLEKQGCHNLLRAGASGVIQAMVLSFGGFRFSNQHLELNINPKYLHRDYEFRRLNYGNMTHVNISIEVTEDNKAVIYVALDRSDRNYYACDAGCLDEPVLLGSSRKFFPVKLTEPLTAILYITKDKQHIEELHKAIHVKEVIEAPAHERHVIALHKHGHHLGGLPTLFWVSICAIIVFFHIFLCKIIVKEYCEPPDKIRHRYNKP